MAACWETEKNDGGKHMGLRRKSKPAGLTGGEGLAEVTGESGADSRVSRQRAAVRLSFDLGRDLHTRLKLESVRRGVPIVRMVSRWVAETMPA